MRDLSSLTKQELINFFNSFDHILSDVDGVVWNFLEPIPRAPEAIESLRNLGKTVVFVTNNTTRTIDSLHEKFTNAGFDIEKENLVTPVLSITSYLQKKGLQHKKVFVISMSPLKQSLTEAGFELVDTTPKVIDTLAEFLTQIIAEEDDVGAVIADVDINLNVYTLQKAATYLRNPDVLFLTGAHDVNIPLSKTRAAIGPGVFNDILESHTKRKPTPMAKLSTYLNDFLIERYNLRDPSRILFMGDSIPEDMGVGTKFGYKKLLVLSGLTGRSCLENWEYEEELKPNFYVESLTEVEKLIERTFGGQL